MSPRKPQTHALMQIHRQIEVVHKNVQIGVLSNLWIPLLMLLVSISPHACSGAWAMHDFNLALTLTTTLCHMNLDLQSFTLSFKFPPVLRTYRPHPQTQRSCRSPKCNLKASSMRASNCLQKAIAPPVRMEPSGSGTYQASPTWAAFSRMPHHLTVTSRSGTCQA